MVLHKEIQSLERQMLDLGARIETTVRQAIRALQTHDVALARKIEAEDSEIDAEEVALEEACLKVLALHQPVAIDLRVIISVLKINNDLERIGDLAAAIAAYTRPAGEVGRIADAPLQWPGQLTTLTAFGTRLVGETLDAFVRLDDKAAHAVCRDEAKFKEVYISLRAYSAKILRETRDSTIVDVVLEHLSVGRSLQRICAHAVNIAEDVIYMLDGVVVRHNRQAKEGGQ